ncbi:hypothetical protein QRO11_19825 [Paracidovorax citrulli]|uniref:hypothetical protein n=2 Tax=Paracidovorax citrulli TaxID=80869 RepID=UPI001F37F3DA|nr:hypothetical protein [Paracidovorax citrulli]WIY34166.1 hypothetical protein QRO11_19825 [Paracidovorax citrulli]
MTQRHQRGRMESSAARAAGALALTLLACLAGGGGLWARGQLHSVAAANPAPQIKAQVATPGRAVGYVEDFEQTPGSMLYVRGWTLSPDEIGSVEVLVNGRAEAVLPYGLQRPDVHAAHPGLPGASNAGFEGRVALRSLDRRIGSVEVVAVDRKGQKTILQRQVLFPDDYKSRWSSYLPERGVAPDEVFYFPIATSHVGEGGADGIRETFAAYESRTVKAGIRVQILYMRTTVGARGDYAFDPDFVPDKKCGQRFIAEDSLNRVMRYAIEKNVPVLFTLNGGIWADAPCDAPQWDINDVLEKDDGLCQWNEKNQVMPDAALSGQPGSFESPELGRSLSLNVFAERARFYKKRNLQQASALIRRFASEHPDLFIGINLDPDVYVNPFFEGKQWYDYNPQTLRQFRDWLRGTGPYANAGGAGVPDLSAYRRPRALTLADVDRLTGRRHANWEEVDPPREFPTQISQFWKDPWTQEWEHFRRHLVKLHYDELSRWVAQTGIPVSRIYSSQGFMPPGKLIDPFAVRLDSPAKNYDSGGMSIEGSVPVEGRLGAIIYGDSAINAIRMEGHASLFDEFRRYSPEWAVVEYNTADLTTPAQMAGYGQAYRSLRDIANYGARFVSPMAWNGSPGEAAGTREYVGYTSLRRTPLEQAIMQFMMSRYDLPRGARLWTFGAGTHDDTDQWQAERGSRIAATPKGLRVVLDGQGRASVVSPAELAVRRGAFDALIVQADGGGEGLRLGVEMQVAGGAWQPLVDETPVQQWDRRSAGFRIPLPAASARDAGSYDRLRLVWRGRPGAAVDLGLVALYPARAATAEPAAR